MTRNLDIHTLLRSLDAADHGGSANTPRARTDLQRIISTDPAPAPLGHPWPAIVAGPGRRPSTSCRTVRRAALAGGMVAAATAALVILPSLSGSDAAFASWTAAPAGMSEADRASAAAECRTSQEGVGGGMFADDVENAALAIAERRGVWTTVVLAGETGFSATCITDDAIHLFDKGMIGSVGRSTGYTAPGSRELTAADLGTGAMSAGEISLAAGSASSDVAGAVYRSRTHGEVTATVSQGRFALWLPGGELQNALREGTEVDMTYRDGTMGKARLAY